MRSLLAGLRTLVLPWGAPSNSPRIVLGPDVPATLSITNVTISSAILWYFNATEYYFIATGTWFTPGAIQVVIKGTYDSVLGITVYEVNRPQNNEMAIGSTAFDANHPDIKYRDVDVVVESGAELYVDDSSGTKVGPVNPIEKFAFGTGNGNLTGAGSANFANVPVTGTNQVIFRKRYAVGVSVLVADIRGGAFATGAVTGVEWGLNVDGALSPAADQAHGAYTFNNPLTMHETFSSILPITGGLDVDTYTITLRWRNPTAAGTITTDGADRWFLNVREVPA